MNQRPPWPPVDVEPAKLHPNAPGPATVLPEHYEQCFGCGGKVAGGLHLKSTVVDERTVVTTFLVGKQHQGAPGLAHGGVLTAAMDEALGTLNVLTQVPAVTGKLETDFVLPVPVGSTVYIAARSDGIAGRKIYCSALGRLNAEDGPIVLRARALFIEVPLEHFSKHGDLPPGLADFNP